MSWINMNTATSGSGLDVDAIVSQLIDAERAPERIWQSQQNILQLQANALTDLNVKLGTLDNNISTLRDVLGAFSANLVTSSDESVLTATADSSATAGWHSIKVASLATNASYYSNALPSSTTVIPVGSFTIKTGSANAVTVTIDETNNTLDKLAAKLNTLGLDIHASMITDANGARLSIAGTKTGKANDVQISGVDGFTFTTSSSADNARLTVDGIPIESTTNQVTGVIGGVTLQLQNVSPEASITLNVSPDSGRVTQAVQNFVNTFNSLITAINAQFAYDATNKTAGVLSGDATIRTLQQQMLGSISYCSSDESDSIATLASIGVTMQDDGTLSFDSAKLNGLMQSDFEGVKKFFQGSGDGTDGFANTFGSVLDKLTDSVDGPLVVDLRGNSESQKSIADQIDDFEVRIEVRRQQLLNQYSQVDAILRQFPLTQSQVTSQLDSLSSLKK